MTEEKQETVVKKRKGLTEAFCKAKVEKAILRAMRTGSGIYKKKIAELIADEAETKFKKKAEVQSKDIDDYVQKALDSYGQGLTAQAYVKYRALKDYRKQDNEIVDSVMGIVHQTDEELINENANKNFRAFSTQRDLAAGEVSKLIARHIIPEHLLLAHQSGVIRIHDLDYFGGVGDKDGLQSGIFNCCLVNLEDQLKNGTVINNKMIANVHRFNKACTIASQIALTVSSGQYGGQSMSISHLAPYLRETRKHWERTIKEDDSLNEQQVSNIVEKLTKKELTDGIKTLNYQLNTFVSSNGQTPFISFFMYVNENPEYKEETAMIIKEIFLQRIEGMPNRYGYNTVQTFPKLLYVLDEDNIAEGTKYWELTKLAAECISKTMVPDLISAKIMKENHHGNVFPCMGCVEGSEVVTYRVNGNVYVEGISEMWKRMASLFKVKEQLASDSYYIDLENVEIYDSTSLSNWTECKRMNKNCDKNDWVRIKLNGGRILTCTSDHPLAVVGKGRTFVKDLKINDLIECSFSSVKLNQANLEEDDYSNLWNKDGNIPNEVFSSSAEIRERYAKDLIKSFGTGVFDVAEPYITFKTKNKVLANQAIILFRGLGYEDCRLQLEDEIIYKVVIVSKNLKSIESIQEHNGESTVQHSCQVCSIESVEIGNYSYDVTTASDRFDVSGIASHNCRSFLSDWKDPKTGEWKYYGRFNKGVQSINLPDVALSAKGDMDTFWKILEERLELCREIGELRVKNLIKNADNLEGSPIHWKYGALSRKKDGEDIVDLLEGGYSTTSLGFIGMYEMCMAILGKSNTTPEGKELCLKVTDFMKKKTEEWNEAWNIGWSLYSTPSEGYCESSYKSTKARFGIVKGVTDHGFFSNSYHVFVNEPIDAFSKLDFESAFQTLSSGGAISYVEVGNLVGNQEVIIEIMKHIYDNIQYAELNTECDRCNECGSVSPLGQDENDNFYCKECGSHNVEAVRRICGYLGVASNGINAAKRKEMSVRVKHI